MKPIYFIGSGGHSVSLAETAEMAGYSVVGFLEVHPSDNTSKLQNALPSMSHGEFGPTAFALAIGENSTRRLIWNQLSKFIPKEQFPPLIHPSAMIARNAVVEAGSQVLQGAIVGSRANIGRCCIINSGSIVDHESELQDFSSVGPGAVLGGRVEVGECTAISIGAIIKHGIRIGGDSVIGAGSFVNYDVPAGVVSYGTPAKVRRTRKPGDKYL